MQRTLTMIAVFLTVCCTAFAQNASISKPSIVQDIKGYNSWPVIQAINDKQNGNKLVCAYSRGSGHTIGEGSRGVFARTSTDNGKTWTPETLVADTPEYGEVTIGKGLDSTGAMLLWIRCVGKDTHHNLYRSTDGITFTLISTPKLNPMPMQITDVFTVPEAGLTALWFAGNYKDDNSHSWGTIVSKDDGKTWTQNVIEKEQSKAEWATEPSAVYLGDGKILAIARTEISGGVQFQMVSTDYGKTWKRTKTNISDVFCSTPSLIYDSETRMLSNYYYYRGKGLLLRRAVKPEDVFNEPLKWAAPEVVAEGSTSTFDAGNVNAVAIGKTHYLAFYSGKHSDTAVLVSAVAAPE